MDVEIAETLITDMTIKNMALEEAKGNVILITVEGVVKIIHIEDDEDWDGNDSNNRDRQ